MIELALGATVRHTRTGGEYTVIGLGKTKVDDGAWIDCVFYYKDGTKELFARDIANFQKNFTARDGSHT